MNLPQFLTDFQIAVRETRARLMFHQPELYPRGPLIRLHIVPPQGVTLPPATDPIGLVWFHQKGELKPVLISYLLGVSLGLDPLLALDICEAADKATPTETRTALEAVIEGEGLLNHRP